MLLLFIWNKSVKPDLNTFIKLSKKKRLLSVCGCGPVEKLLEVWRSLLPRGAGFQTQLWLLIVWLSCGFLYFLEKNLVLRSNKTTLLIMLCSCDGQAPAAQALVHHSRREGLDCCQSWSSLRRVLVQSVFILSRSRALNPQSCFSGGFFFGRAFYTLRYAASTSSSLSTTLITPK